MGAAEVLNGDLGVTRTIVNDLEGPRLHILLDGRVIEAATDETPVQKLLADCRCKNLWSSPARSGKEG